MGYAAQILLDSVSPAADRVTSFEVQYPRMVHSELMTHRTFCLAGDTLLSFDLPGGSRAGRCKRIHQIMLETFVDRWHNGAERYAARQKRPLDLSDLDPDAYYDAPDLASRIDFGKSNIHKACRDGVLLARKEGNCWRVRGSDFAAWRASRPNNTRFDVTDRLSNMSIRQYNEQTGQIQTSHVVDCCYSGEKPTYTVQATGYSVTGSADHRVLTSDGWKVIGDLRTSDSIVVARSGHMNKVDPERLLKVDGRWRSSWQREQRVRLLAEYGGCQGCGSLDDCEVHHVIPVHVDPTLTFEVSNVRLLCERCHRDEHASQGWQAPHELYGDVVDVRRVSRAIEEPTFDLTVSGEYPNFLANGVVVHNSRNAASSRAIPVAKMIQRVIDDPVIPEFGRNQAGMQAARFADDWTDEQARATWLAARDDAVRAARQMAGLGIHKQTSNRLLEPFAWITVVITATDYQSFFAQRASRYSPLAQPELRTIADMMLDLYEASVPDDLCYADWHTPYIQPDESFENNSPRRSNLDLPAVEKRKQISVARCARVSYLTQNGVRDHEKDLELYERLVSARPLHASPLEHCATPTRPGATQVGNLHGWRQMRHEVEARAVAA